MTNWKSYHGRHKRAHWWHWWWPWSAIISARMELAAVRLMFDSTLSAAESDRTESARFFALVKRVLPEEQFRALLTQYKREGESTWAQRFAERAEWLQIKEGLGELADGGRKLGGSIRD
jgi:hypothetical protein